MNINWNIKRSHHLAISHYAFSDAKVLASDIRTTESVDFVVRHNTKTSLAITISCQKGDGRHCFDIAHIPAGAERFSFLETMSRNIFDGRVTTRRYFRLTRKQGLEELKEYLRLVLAQILPDVQTLNAEMMLFNVPEFEAA